MTKPKARTNPKSKRKHLFAAIDLHCKTSVLGTMDPEGNYYGHSRFPTREQELIKRVRAIPARRVELTIEASPIARWAAGVLRPHVSKLIVCDPRQNRLIACNPDKRDEFDTRDLCRLNRMGELKEVWMGDDGARDAFRAAVYDMLKLRDAARDAKILLKSRLQGWGLPVPAGREIFGKVSRQPWLGSLPSDEARAAIAPLYEMFDATKSAEASARTEVRNQGRAFPETGLLQEVPGVGFAGAHVFVAIVEDPHRFAGPKQINRYAALAITCRSSDGKQLGYERLDRRGHRELKNLSYHAWRTSTRSTTRDNGVKAYYHATREKLGVVRRARLSTQRKILATMLSMWKGGQHYSDEKFYNNPGASEKGKGVATGS